MNVKCWIGSKSAWRSDKNQTDTPDFRSWMAGVANPVILHPADSVEELEANEAEIVAAATARVVCSGN